MWLAALPLLAASLSRDPQLVSLLEFAAGVPWLLFGLSAGVLADRWDRRDLMWRTDLIRLGLVAVLAVLVATDVVTVPVLLVVVFLLATVGTLFSSAAPALLPSLVPSAELPRANARLAAGNTSGKNFVGPSAGAWLFSVFPWAPFAVDALSFVVSAWGVRGLPRSTTDRDKPPRRAVRHEVREGLAWIWRIRTLRVLAVSGSLLALATSAFLAIFVLFSLEVLRLPEVGYGVLISVYAVGNLLGSFVSAGVVRRLGLRWATQIAAVVGALAFLGIGVTALWPMVAGALVVFGIATSIWNIASVTIRQSLTPANLLGRISSTFAMLGVGSASLGAPLGGLLAKQFGLPAAILFAAGVAAVSALLMMLRPPVIPPAN
jgi:MFS family permease